MPRENNAQFRTTDDAPLNFESAVWKHIVCLFVCGVFSHFWAKQGYKLPELYANFAVDSYRTVVTRPTNSAIWVYKRRELNDQQWQANRLWIEH